jgi:AcrR family transcriptional regulator
MKHGERRKAQILETGLTLWPDITARSIAKVIGLTHSAVLYHFKSSDALKDAIANHAVGIRCDRVVPMLIVARHAAVETLTNVERANFLSQV